MALKPKSTTPPETKADEQPSQIQSLPAPPPPAEEIAELKRVIADMKLKHERELAREQGTTQRVREDLAETKEELEAILESPILRVLSAGGNMIEMEGRLKELCETCANAATNIKGAMTIKIEVASGRGGDGSVEFSITDTVKRPVEDEGACILWLDNGKLSESNAKQRDLLDIPPGKRRPNPTDEERLAAAREAADESDR